MTRMFGHTWVPSLGHRRLLPCHHNHPPSASTDPGPASQDCLCQHCRTRSFASSLRFHLHQKSCRPWPQEPDLSTWLQRWSRSRPRAFASRQRRSVGSRCHQSNPVHSPGWSLTATPRPPEKSSMRQPTDGAKTSTLPCDRGQGSGTAGGCCRCCSCGYRWLGRMRLQWR